MSAYATSAEVSITDSKHNSFQVTLPTLSLLLYYRFHNISLPPYIDGETQRGTDQKTGNIV